MHIEAIQKLTLLDFPGRTAATVFLHGCNFRCPFCHNARLVVKPSAEKMETAQLLGFLEKRRGLLDGVCITGGEPTLYPDLPDLIRQIHDLGYAVKLDTNGTNPHMLSALMDEELLDYVAMDIKNSPQKYDLTAGVSDDRLFARVCASVQMLLCGNVDYEFRTTVCGGGMHTAADMEEIGKWITGAKRYFLQPFKDSGELIEDFDFSISEDEVRALLDAVKPYIPTAKIRGIA